MRDRRHIALTIAFIGAVVGVPVTQAIVDLRSGMRPQALDLFDLPEPDPALGFVRRTAAYLAAIMDGERLRGFEDDLETNSVFERHGREGFQFAALLATTALGEKAIRGEDGWYFYHPGVRYLVEPYFRSPRSASRADADPVEAIVDTAAQLRARGIELLVVLVPGKASIYPDRLTESVQPSPGVYANTTALLGELQQRGIETLDLHRVLTAARHDHPDQQLFMKTDTHWTGEGVRVASRALAERIRAGGWTPELRAEPYYLRRPVRVHRYGDVIEMTKIPGRQVYFGDETVEVDQVIVASTGAPYEDGPDSPILLLGDSFSRVFQTDEPGAAGLIANLAYELQSPLASLVDDGGASTRVRQRLKRKPELLTGKRLVVWELIERDIRFGKNGWAKVDLGPEPSDETDRP